MSIDFAVQHAGKNVSKNANKIDSRMILCRSELWVSTPASDDYSESKRFFLELVLPKRDRVKPVNYFQEPMKSQQILPPILNLTGRSTHLAKDDICGLYVRSNVRSKAQCRCTR